MMRFTYEEDGVTVAMETDTENLMSDYSRDGILEQFSRFLAACGTAVWPDDVLQFVNESKEIVLDSEEYNRLLSCERDVLDRLQERANGDSTIAQAWRESDPGWIEWSGGLQPVDATVEVQLSNGEILEDHADNLFWDRRGAGKSIAYDIIAYRVVEQGRD
jgi:hypothetical protein